LASIQAISLDDPADSSAEEKSGSGVFQAELAA
jgi:hypothetical protein